MLSPSLLLALALPLSYQPDPRLVLERAATAIGGLERLRRLPPLRVEEEGHEYMVGTPGSAAGPRRMILSRQIEIRSGAKLRWHRILRLPMRPGPVEAIQVVDGARSATSGPAGWRPDGYQAWEAAVAELELAPERIVLTALDAPDLREEPDAIIEGRAVHVVRFGYRRGVARLTLDAASGLPGELRLTRAWPADPFQAMWGDIVLGVRWSSWSLEPGGLWYPRLRSISSNGEAFREFAVTALDLADSVARADLFAVPDSVLARFSATPAAPVTISRVVAEPLGRDLVIYAGGYQAAAVRQRDGIVVIEAPESSAKSRAVLADLAVRWPGIRVIAVIVTSPMSMHLGGAREYVARGIPIYATAGVSPILRRLAAAPFTTAPDSLARRPRAPRIVTVGGPMVLGSGAAALTLRPGDGPHGGSMLLVHWPNRRLLYGSDILVPDAFEPTFAAAYRAEFLATVDRARLVVDTVFALHVSPMPLADVRLGGPIPAARR